VCVLGLFGGGGDTGSDGPDGFVGEDGFGEVLFGEVAEAFGDLGAEDGFEFSGFAFC